MTTRATGRAVYVGTVTHGACVLKAGLERGAHH